MKSQAPPPADDAAHLPEEVKIHTKKKHRTTGLWIFDAVLYNISNFVVFALSVGATYLTNTGGVFKMKADDPTAFDLDDKGHKQKVLGADGLQKYDGSYGGFGEWMFQRGAKLSKNLQKWFKLNEDQADMGKMVFFSFLDGSLVAPLVKLLEDRREKIAYWIDEKLGTLPEDKSVYEAEPKQSWDSVLMGRFATAAIIVPTAVFMDKFGRDTNTKSFRFSKGKDDETFKSMNDIAFNDPGYAHGKALEEKGKLKWLGKTDKKDLFKTMYFEAFYTTVCTAGLYYASRLIARLTGKTWGAAHEKEEKKKHEQELKTHRAVQHAPAEEKAIESEHKHKPLASDDLKTSHKRTAPINSFSERHDPANALQHEAFLSAL